MTELIRTAKELAASLAPGFYSPSPGWALPAGCKFVKDFELHDLALFDGNDESSGERFNLPSGHTWENLGFSYVCWLELQYTKGEMEGLGDDSVRPILKEIQPCLVQDWDIAKQMFCLAAIEHNLIINMLQAVNLELALGRPGKFAENFFQIFKAGGVVIGAHAVLDITYDNIKIANMNELEFLVYWPHEKDPSFGSFPGWPWAEKDA